MEKWVLRVLHYKAAFNRGNPNPQRIVLFWLCTVKCVAYQSYRLQLV
jgi:hypothetical protein